MLWRILVIAVLLPLPGCPRTDVPDPAQPVALVILHTNDTHGYIWGSDARGSAAQMATLADQARREVTGAGGVLLLLDAGDVRTGTYCSDHHSAEPDLRAMDAMGYDALVVGNHEFDLPHTLTLRQRALVSFPLLGANVIDTATDRPLLDPVTIIERGGLRIAILGLVTEQTGMTSTAGRGPELRFEDPIAVAGRLVPGLRAQADVVIALTHIGLDQDRELARAVEGIDVIVGGHSHDALETPEREGSTVIVTAGSYGDYLGRLDLDVGPAGVELVGGRLLPVTPDLPAQPEVAAVLESFACSESQEHVIALAAPITREPLAGPGSSSALANLVSDAFRAVAEADLALINRGGMRADLPAGELTTEHMHATLPFDNSLVVVEATGADLIAIARSVFARGPDGRGIIHTSGMRFVFGPADAVYVDIGGQPPGSGAHLYHRAQLVHRHGRRRP